MTAGRRWLTKFGILIFVEATRCGYRGRYKRKLKSQVILAAIFVGLSH
jgi:hypothetical protein